MGLFLEEFLLLIAEWKLNTPTLKYRDLNLIN
jgi:hypothetical protein